MPLLRTTLLTVTAFLAGVVLGHVLSEPPAPAGTEFPRPPEATSSHTELPAPPTLAGRAGTEAGVSKRGAQQEHDATTPRRGAAPASDEATPGAPPFEPEGVFEVLVTNADGEPVYAQVYATPRDATEWNDAPEGYQEPPGPCRLRIPVPGTYDLFARTQSPPGMAGREDVRVRAGETVRVHLAYETAVPIRFVAAPPWPVGELLERGRLEGEIHVIAREAKGWRVDTNHRGHAFGRGRPLYPAEGPWTSVPLPPSGEYEVQVRLKAAEGGAGLSSPYGVIAEPPIAKAGDTVTLHARPFARVHLRFEIQAPEAWPDGPIELEVRLEHAGGVRDYTYRWRHRQALVRRKGPLILSGSPGAARVRWDGPGIAAGVIEGLVLDPQQTSEHRVVLEVDPEELPSLEPLVVTVLGLGDAAAYEDEGDFQLAALLPSKNADYPSVLSWGDDPAAEVELNHGWRRASHVVARLGKRFASPPVPVPRDGPVTVALEPAGHLVVVPDRLTPGDMGVLRIRRADGLPFLVSPGGQHEAELRESTLVWAGDLVGPLPAGRHVFEAESMGKRLEDAVVHVAAGRLGVLPLRERP